MHTNSPLTSTPKIGGEIAQAVAERGAGGEGREACAVGCAVTPAEREAIRVLIGCRPTLDVEALVAVLRAAPLCAAAQSPKLDRYAQSIESAPTEAPR